VPLVITLTSEEAVRQLEVIKQLTGLQSFEQVFNDALAFFELAAKKRKEGWQVVAVNGDMTQYKVLSMGSLDQTGQLDDVKAQTQGRRIA
jgi:hypothetical protein